MRYYFFNPFSNASLCVQIYRQYLGSTFLTLINREYLSHRYDSNTTVSSIFNRLSLVVLRPNLRQRKGFVSFSLGLSTAFIDQNYGLSDNEFNFLSSLSAGVDILQNWSIVANKRCIRERLWNSELNFYCPTSNSSHWLDITPIIWLGTTCFRIRTVFISKDCIVCCQGWSIRPLDHLPWPQL